MEQSTVVKVVFIHYVWDNYQGASGKPVKIERLIELPSETLVNQLKEFCINSLDSAGYVDSWNQSEFTGKGLISIILL